MKRFLVFLLSLALLLSAVGGSVRPALADETLRSAKKVISVVYDDSGSMMRDDADRITGERWIYASYAMQALIALLNSHDELYITFMSNPGKAVNITPSSNIEQAVEDIRRHATSADSTPGQALETARDVLDTVTGEDGSTQYWLMVLTDGEFHNMTDSIQNWLHNRKGAKMSNGSALNIVYLSMKDSASTVVSADPNNGLHTFVAETADQITDRMAKIANLVSCRLTADNVTQLSPTTFQFATKLPMYSIAVLSQNSQARLESGTAGGQSLQVDRNIPLKATEPFGYSNMAVSGNAAVLTSSSVIPAGTCTVTFSEEVKLQDLVIQYEPAIGMHMELRKSGVTVSDPSTLLVGDRVEVQLTPVIPGTNTPIASQDLPQGTSFRVEYLVDGNEKAAKDGQVLPDAVIEAGDNVLRGIMRIPGFAPIVYEQSFHILPYIYDPGLLSEQPDKLSYLRSDLSKSEEGGEPVFRITNEGVAIDADTCKLMDLDLVVTEVSCDNSAVTGFLNTFGKNKVICYLSQNADGSYALKLRGWPAFLLMAGDYTVTVAIRRDPGFTAQAHFTVVPQLSDWIDLLWVLIILACILILLWTLLIKRKFATQTVRREVYELSGDEAIRRANRTVSLTPLTGLFCLSPAAARKKLNSLGGITVVAGPGGTAVVPAKSVMAQGKFFCVDSSDPETSLQSILNAMQPCKVKVERNTEIMAYDVTLDATMALFVKKSETSNRVVRYTIVQNNH